jgi:dihydroxy-acid dehydratase
MSCCKTASADCSSSCSTPCNSDFDMTNLKTRSLELTGDINDTQNWISRTAARAMMRGVGYTDADFRKPLVAVAAPYTDVTPCNAHLRELGDIIHKELTKLNVKPFQFGTPVVTDGETMGMSGMRYSLPSRDLIADCIEMMTEAYQCDGVITLCGCDKTIPAALMPLARNNLTGIVLYGGSILPGELDGKPLDVVSPFEAVGRYSSGKINYDEFLNVEKNACPTCGACGGMYTANTMSTAIEAMGMSIPYSSSNPANTYSGRIHEDKYMDCVNASKCLMIMLQKGIKARDIMTKKAFENAITVVMALGGSTNAVLHLLAIAHEAEVDLTLEDFQIIGDRVPIIADMKPSGRYVMYDLYKQGGVPVVMKVLLDGGLLHGDCMTCTGMTIAENLAGIKNPFVEG